MRQTWLSGIAPVFLRRASLVVVLGAFAGVIVSSSQGAVVNDKQVAFGPGNPFYAKSTLPFEAPPFDKIKDGDYEPAIEAGMAEELKEIGAIADNSAAPTFENTVVAMEKTGSLFQRAMAAFSGVTGANTNPELERVQKELAPKLAAHRDAIYLNTKLFHRVAAVYEQRESLKLSPEGLRLVQVRYRDFVHAGANLSDADKDKLRKLNEEESTLSNGFRSKVLAATKDAAYATTDQAALAGLTAADLSGAEAAAKERKKEGYVLPLQNTTQQPYLSSLSVRATRQAVFDASWTRTERGDANDTRSTIARLAQLRAEKGKLLGHDSYAGWKLEDQMAKTPENALKFMDALVAPSTANAADEAKDIQGVIDSQNNDTQKGGFSVEAWDWEFYSEQVRKAKYDIDEAQVRPYFELNNVLENGVFYAAGQLYGLSFKERKDIPVWNPDVRVFEVFDGDSKPLALFYCDYYKRDNKNGGAWMSNFVDQSKLMGTLPVVYNVANLPKPAAGEPALVSFSDVVTMFHEFGHALHGMLADSEYPSLSGTSVARDFVEFPSQFNEHWATYPAVFAHYAKHYKTGAAMPEDLATKIKKAADFNQGYLLTELLAAAELDMQWHSLPVGDGLQEPDAFEKAALAKKGFALSYVPPRYRSSYFSHIWGGGYAAGYYAYLWSEMLDDDAFQWFQDHGGLTRANGDRFRKMVLSRGNTEDLAKMYEAWLGSAPKVEPMLKYRGLEKGATK
ncbi:M3 family metallopeptidase [Tunturiibacter gelidoferens]|uniref:Dipeptidyl carboxypeptidase n=1 Tax=Tunturiibacter lichenicola TaxID=2051959 RepID=A0A7Y9T472_9BACT|nr:M3 family metallopeptidase [Edaphobacter lichenicola]NYF53142.1 peptidyl-dipeptidase Dcp [Edaphobacter lichenicola]